MLLSFDPDVCPEFLPWLGTAPVSALVDGIERLDAVMRVSSGWESIPWNKGRDHYENARALRYFVQGAVAARSSVPTVRR